MLSRACLVLCDAAAGSRDPTPPCVVDFVARDIQEGDEGGESALVS